jgi:recombinational DNA repair ATPase RecF
MTGYPYHQTLRLENFTAFKDTEFEFVPGINAFVGENGTGKTHVMKALYAFQRTASRLEADFQATLAELFQIRNTANLVRLESDIAIAGAHGRYNDIPWNYRVEGSDGSAGFGNGTGYGRQFLS